MGHQTSSLKHAYELLPPNNNNVVLVHYMGNERAAVPFQHGHATGLRRAYVRTCPSVLRSTKNECSQSTSATYSLQETCNWCATRNAYVCEAATKHRAGQKYQVKAVRETTTFSWCPVQSTWISHQSVWFCAVHWHTPQPSVCLQQLSFARGVGSSATN